MSYRYFSYFLCTERQRNRLPLVKKWRKPDKIVYRHAHDFIAKWRPFLKDDNFACAIIEYDAILPANLQSSCQNGNYITLSSAFINTISNTIEMC